MVGGSWWWLVGGWWLVVVGGGWWWLVVVGGGWWWLVVVGGGWWWLVVVGSGWLLVLTFALFFVGTRLSFSGRRNRKNGRNARITNKYEFAFVFLVQVYTVFGVLPSNGLIGPSAWAPVQNMENS